MQEFRGWLWMCIIRLFTYLLLHSIWAPLPFVLHCVTLTFDTCEVIYNFCKVPDCEHGLSCFAYGNMAAYLFQIWYPVSHETRYLLEEWDDSTQSGYAYVMKERTSTRIPVFTADSSYYFEWVFYLLSSRFLSSSIYSLHASASLHAYLHVLL